MRILHLSNDLYPRVTGGTEIFVQQLVRAQQDVYPACSVIWAAHDSPQRDPDHSPDASLDTNQRLLPAIILGDRLQQAGATAASIPGFVELLTQFKPDVVHLHSFSDRCGLSHVRIAKATGASIVVTVHAPGFSCIKGNLIDARGSICDGVLRKHRCTSCRLHNGGIPRWLAGVVALQSGWPLTAEDSGYLAHLLTARKLTVAFQRAWLELAQLADAIHVLAAWSRDVLLRQDIPDSKVHLIRTAGPPLLPPRRRTPFEDGVLRLVYWGRCHPVKGLHLVIEAILRLPQDVPLQFDCYGPYWDGSYGQHLLRLIKGDPRIRVLGQLNKDDLLHKLQYYDLAVVPSTWLETGPLTVLEAFAAGLPVAGSDLGGIKELLEGVEGCFLLPLEVSAWHDLLVSLLRQTGQIGNIHVPHVSQFSELAFSLQRLYRTTSCHP